MLPKRKGRISIRPYNAELAFKNEAAGASPSPTLDLVTSPLSCHSERSAEDERMARSKAENLHGVELFLHGLV